MSAIYTCLRRDVCGKAAVQRFRQDGILIVNNFLEGPSLHQLSQSVAVAAKERGPHVFPGVDPDHAGALQFDMKVRPQAAARLADLPPPDELKRVVDNNDARQELDRHVQKVKIKCKNQKRVDRLFRKLTKRRNQMQRVKNIPSFITTEEEVSGSDVSEERLKEISEQYKYDDVKGSFEEYRDNGRMEGEIRRSNHIDDTLQYLENWGRYWVNFWQRLPKELRESLGSCAGAAVSHLTGEVAVRLYSDTTQEFVPFTNGVPFHCVASGLNFAHLNSVSAFVFLAPGAERQQKPRCRHVVVPGSHHVIASLSDEGKDFSLLPMHHVLDAGYLMRHTPELRMLPIVELPPLSPGTAVFMSTFLVNAFLPMLEGPLSVPFCFPSHQPSIQPDVFNMTIMPDRCVFDGERNSWFSKDSHGPLSRYKKGDYLSDDKHFPLLHRALDIE